MLIHFWGVRGSIPTPISPQQVQSKIMAAIQRATPADLQNAETRSKFISNLPSWIFGTTGGNTTCVELVHNDKHIILDAGSGLRALGKERECPSKYYLFLSHLHWDHLNGFPFFDHAFNPNLEIQFYSNHDNAEKFFRGQMDVPYSPPSVSTSITKKLYFNQIKEGEPFYIDDIKVNSCKMRHPGDSYSFSFEADGKKFVFATDVELKASDFKSKLDTNSIFYNADAIIIDAQYTTQELNEKVDWGHSSFCYAIDFAIHYQIKEVYLFHHDPTYDDKKLEKILQASQWYAKYINHSDMKIYLAKEDTEFIL